MEVLIDVLDLMEMDHYFAKVMLYMSPHKSVFLVLQKVNPILATSFYKWYFECHGKEIIVKAAKEIYAEVGMYT